MKERGILFSTEMVRANQEGKKTMTRRTRGLEKINVNPSEWMHPIQLTVDPLIWTWRNTKTFEIISIKCPYGQVGDRLWVRERHCIECYKNDGVKDPCHYFDEDSPHELNDCEKAKWRPSIFMPRWASRINLEITNIRVERIQNISHEDAIAEGITIPENGIPICGPVEWFHVLWDSINAKRGYSWESNPWVWPIKYEVVK